MQVIGQPAAELKESRAARELMESHAFVADAWPGEEARTAARRALESLPAAGRAWALVDGEGWQWLAVSAPLDFDSRLFGRRLARLWPLAHRTAWPAPEARDQGRRLLAEVTAAEKEAGSECLVARVAGRDFLAAQVLEAAGFRLMDVSVEWLLDLEAPARHEERPALPPGMAIRAWRPDEEEALQALAADAMCELAAYADRFAMDPRLRPQCRQMYRRWVANSLSGDQADQVLVLAREDEPAGLITLKLPAGTGPGADCGWVVINAIAPELRGRGLYHQLLGRGLEWLARHGARQARVRTKLSQQAVIRAWAALGGHQVYSDITFHLWLDQDAA